MRRADSHYHLHVPINLKSGSLNLLEPSGPVKACNGIALPLPLFPYILVFNSFDVHLAYCSKRVW
jgi:hypothetical protein